MKQQTFIVRLEDKKNHVIDFERFADKRLTTVQRKIINLYTKYFCIYKDDIAQAHHLTIYETLNNGKEIKQVVINQLDLMRLIGQI